MLFKDVMVDESIKENLINLVKNNRVSHAQLFLSTPGNHAFALAVAYAQYVSCHNRGEHDSCGVCPSCVKFEKLAHPDFHLIFPNVAKNSNDKEYNANNWMPEFREYVFKNNYHISINSWLKELGGENKQASINNKEGYCTCSWLTPVTSEGDDREYYTVVKGDTLWQIAKKHGITLQKLLELNTIKNPNVIQIGQKIRIK